MRRIEWLDDIKGFAITLVVAGHVIATLCNMTIGGVQAMMQRVFDIIYDFHIPLFFVIAGLTFSSNNSFGNFAKRKFLRLMVPYYVWGIMGMLLSLLLGQIVAAEIQAGSTTSHFASKTGGSGLLAMILSVIHAGGWPEGKGFWFNGVLWFLPVMFVVELLYYWIAKLCKERSPMVFLSFVLLWLFLLYWSPMLFQLSGVKGIYLPFNLALVPLFMPILSLGHWFALRFIRKEAYVTKGAVYYKVLSGFVLAYIVAVYFCPFLGMYRWDMPEMNLSVYYILRVLRIIAAVAILLMLARFGTFRFFAFLAPMTIGIMLFHKYPLVICQLLISRLGGIANRGMMSVCAVALTLTALLTFVCYGAALLISKFAPWSLGVNRK